MFKLFKEYNKDLEDVQIGKLMKMCCAFIENEEIPKSDDRVVEYLYKTRFQPQAERYIAKCKQNSQNAKGHGRPRKAGKTE